MTDTNTPASVVEDALFADEPWAKLAIEAGFRPYDTESSARRAFAFCANKIAALSQPSYDELLLETLERARIELYRRAEESNQPLDTELAADIEHTIAKAKGETS